MPSRKASRKASEAKKVPLSWVSGSKSGPLDGTVVEGDEAEATQPVFQGEICSSRLFRNVT